MSREVDIRENWEGTNRIKEVVVAAAVMIMVAVVSAVMSVARRWDSHIKRSFFTAKWWSYGLLVAAAVHSG